jgi:class 3 adenylate cyclase
MEVFICNPIQMTNLIAVPRSSPQHEYDGGRPTKHEHTVHRAIGNDLGAVMDLGLWLRSLGFEQYEAAFRDNAIDETVLPDLTAEDLKDLGVHFVGHRRRLLDAIAALRTDANSKPAPVDAVQIIDRIPKDTAERRQVTVMFADLVGSTALSTGMDPEDLREVISSYQRCVAETVRRFGGFVGRYLGDGALVYFGYPEAHEDDAERAVRAALELIAALAELKTRSPQKVRVGIATGLVVVGHLMPSGESDIVACRRVLNFTVSGRWNARPWPSGPMMPNERPVFVKPRSSGWIWPIELNSWIPRKMLQNLPVIVASSVICGRPESLSTDYLAEHLELR